MIFMILVEYPLDPPNHLNNISIKNNITHPPFSFHSLSLSLLIPHRFSLSLPFLLVNHDLSHGSPFLSHDLRLSAPPSPLFTLSISLSLSLSGATLSLSFIVTMKAAMVTGLLGGSRLGETSSDFVRSHRILARSCQFCYDATFTFACSVKYW